MASIYGSSSVSDGTNNVAFLRITLIGASGSGKSSLANAFVNNVAIYEHQPTTDLTLYYTRVEINSDDGTFYALVEIEDTWASNKVAPDKMAVLYDPWWPMTHKQSMEAERSDKKPKSHGFKPGGRYAVCRCGHGRSDHEGGSGMCKVLPCNCDKLKEEGPSVLNPFSGSGAPELWGVPCYRDHTLKLLPDKSQAGWFCNGKWEEAGCKSGFTTKVQTKGLPRYRCEPCDYNLCEKCHDAKAKALTSRTVAAHDMDHEGRKYRPLTRNRMAYFLVFDTNDMESYKEALTQEKALKDYLEQKKIKVQPVIFLVGTKIDVDPDADDFRNVQFSANTKSVKDSIRYKEVSSMKFQGVKRLFREAVQSIRTRQQLWLLEHGIRNHDSELKADGCWLQ